MTHDAPPTHPSRIIGSVPDAALHPSRRHVLLGAAATVAVAATPLDAVRTATAAGTYTARYQEKY